ncbi:zinc finger protein 654 isoform X3 [Protopterus annectens]|uniref:zinc finger protein 654 isoform X2 n=1 Tax=Protopterus annectens TaxID=7888 RepID=UPI001CFB1D73|nr:zinc finger protein 654 isoform X2 [Protopterus annectens]XP_043928074.1 zinc finger protein 654 isoform X3 [Protopterus annectens]
MAEEESEQEAERLREELESLLVSEQGSVRCDRIYCHRFCQVVEEYTGRYQVPLPQLQVLQTALCCFTTACSSYPAEFEPVHYVLRSLALSFFELLLFFGKDEFSEDPLSDIHNTLQECCIKLKRFGCVDLEKVTKIMADGGPWDNTVLQTILAGQTPLQDLADAYLSSENPLFFEFRARYLTVCERMPEALALIKCCVDHPATNKTLYFHQAYLTCICRPPINLYLLFEHTSKINCKDAIEIICSVEEEGKIGVALELCNAFLAQQLYNGDMYNIWDLIFVWSKLQLRVDSSKQTFIDHCCQILKIATNVKVIFPFLKVIETEVGDKSLQYRVEICGGALQMNLCDKTKCMIYKTIAYLLPNDLEICRTCALLVFFLERSRESYRTVERLFKHPDQEYNLFSSTIQNHIRFELLQLLKKGLSFDPEFWSFVMIEKNCVALIKQQPKAVKSWKSTPTLRKTPVRRNTSRVAEPAKRKSPRGKQSSEQRCTRSKRLAGLKATCWEKTEQHTVCRKKNVKQQCVNTKESSDQHIMSRRVSLELQTCGGQLVGQQTVCRNVLGQQAVSDQLVQQLTCIDKERLGQLSASDQQTDSIKEFTEQKIASEKEVVCLQTDSESKVIEQQTEVIEQQTVSEVHIVPHAFDGKDLTEQQTFDGEALAGQQASGSGDFAGSSELDKQQDASGQELVGQQAAGGGEVGDWQIAVGEELVSPQTAVAEKLAAQWNVEQLSTQQSSTELVAQCTTGGGGQLVTQWTTGGGGGLSPQWSPGSELAPQWTPGSGAELAASQWAPGGSSKLSSQQTTLGEELTAQQIIGSDQIASQWTTSMEEFANQHTSVGEELVAQQTAGVEGFAAQGNASSEGLAVQGSTDSEWLAAQLAAANRTLATQQAGCDEELAAQQNAGEKLTGQWSSGGEEFARHQLPGFEELIRPQIASTQKLLGQQVTSNGGFNQQAIFGKGLWQQTTFHKELVSTNTACCREILGMQATSGGGILWQQVTNENKDQQVAISDRCLELHDIFRKDPSELIASGRECFGQQAASVKERAQQQTACLESVEHWAICGGAACSGGLTREINPINIISHPPASSESSNKIPARRKTEEGREKSERNVPKHLCAVCNKEFLGGHIVRHALAHQKKGCFSCVICTRKFRLQESILKHLQNHLKKIKMNPLEVRDTAVSDPCLHGSQASDSCSSVENHSSASASSELPLTLVGTSHARDGSDTELLNSAENHLDEEKDILKNGINRISSESLHEVCQKKMDIIEEAATCTVDLSVWHKLNGSLTSPESLQLIEQGGTLKCPSKGCFKVFKQAQSLNKHAKRVHADDLNVRQYMLNWYKGKCRYCLRKFTSSKHFMDHLQRHVYPKVHFCLHFDCSESFKLVSELHAHSKVHAVFQAQCTFPDCGLLFEALPALFEHEAQHYVNDTPDPSVEAAVETNAMCASKPKCNKDKEQQAKSKKTSKLPLPNWTSRKLAAEPKTYIQVNKSTSENGDSNFIEAPPISSPVIDELSVAAADSKSSSTTDFLVNGQGECEKEATMVSSGSASESSVTEQVAQSLTQNGTFLNYNTSENVDIPDSTMSLKPAQHDIHSYTPVLKRPFVRPQPPAYLDERYISMPKRRKTTEKEEKLSQADVNLKNSERYRCPNCFTVYSHLAELEEHHAQKNCQSLFGFDSDDESKLSSTSYHINTESKQNKVEKRKEGTQEFFLPSVGSCESGIAHEVSSANSSKIFCKRIARSKGKLGKVKKGNIRNKKQSYQYMIKNKSQHQLAKRSSLIENWRTCKGKKAKPSEKDCISYTCAFKLCTFNTDNIFKLKNHYFANHQACKLRTRKTDQVSLFYRCLVKSCAKTYRSQNRLRTHYMRIHRLSGFPLFLIVKLSNMRQRGRHYGRNSVPSEETSTVRNTRWNAKNCAVCESRMIDVKPAKGVLPRSALEKKGKQRKHKRSHHLSGGFSCKKCLVVFSVKEDLDNHCRNNHSSPAETDTSRAGKSSECSAKCSPVASRRKVKDAERAHLNCGTAKLGNEMLEHKALSLKQSKKSGVVSCSRFFKIDRLKTVAELTEHLLNKRLPPNLCMLKGCSSSLSSRKSLKRHYVGVHGIKQVIIRESQSILFPVLSVLPTNRFRGGVKDFILHYTVQDGQGDDRTVLFSSLLKNGTQTCRAKNAKKTKTNLNSKADALLKRRRPLVAGKSDVRTHEITTSKRLCATRHHEGSKKCSFC